MENMIIKIFKILLLSIALISSCAADEQNFSNHFFYAGGMFGNANENWSDVVSTDPLTQKTNPLSADGNGILFGLDAGYQFSPHFAIEGEMISLPSTKLVFYQKLDPYKTPDNMYNVGVVNASMVFAAVEFKVIAPLPNSKFSLFVDAGPGYVYMDYPITNIGIIVPTFGGGLLYRINDHWQAEGAFQYAPGTGKSVGDPMYFFVPETYAGTFKLDYIF
jgi:hypothetical protein